MAGEKKTLDDIAGMLMQAPAPDAKAVANEDDDAPIVGEDDLDASAEEDLIDDNDDVSDEDVDDDVDEQEEDDTSDDDDDTDEKPVLDINEDDIIEVMIDGKLEHRTIGEAMKALSGEGAIEKRLTEATEERKAAQAERTEWARQREVQTQSLINAFNALGGVVFEPRVSPPDENLRQTNPQKYLIQQGDYEKEARRLETLQQQVGQLFQGIQQEILDGEKEFRKAQQKLLSEKLPVLQDPKMGKARQKMIIDAAQHYGFTPQEINIASDHRLFLMAHDAALYRASQQKKDAKGKEVKIVSGKQPRKVPRTLRSGNVSKAKTRAMTQQKQVQALKAKAAKSGKVDDIAAFIMQSRN